MKRSFVDELIRELGYDPNTVVRLEFEPRGISVVVGGLSERHNHTYEESTLIEYEEESTSEDHGEPR